MDLLVSDYLEFLWASGEGKSVANNTLAALQDQDPNLERKLPGSWRLMKAWSTAEIPNRAPPLTKTLLDALCGWSVMKGCLLIWPFSPSGVFRTFAHWRTLKIQAKDIYLTSSRGPAVIFLGLTKSGACQRAAGSVTVYDTSVLPSLCRWKQQAQPHTYLTVKPHAWRCIFNQALEGMELSSIGFRPYSLRRGGATFFFQYHGSFDKLLVQGRWAAAKTARIYLNEALAQLSEISVPNSHLRYYLSLYTKHPILEPGTRKAPRAGGRGKKASKILFCFARQRVWESETLKSLPEFSGEINQGHWGAPPLPWFGGERGVWGPV